MINNQIKFSTIFFFTFVFIFSTFLFVQCKENNQSKIKQQALKLKNKINIKVPEPSGITFNKNSKSFLIVSDESSRIYKLSIDGKITDSLDVNGFDLEGITYQNDSTLITILERDRAVVILSDDGKEISRFSVGLYGKPNSGLEGISFNPNNNHIYVLNEKNPGLLLELDLDGKEIFKKKLKFAKDFSGLFYDEVKNELWITSHENKAVYRCKIDGTVLNTFSIEVPQVEGIAIDFKSKEIYLVCDKTESLLIYSLP